MDKGVVGLRPVSGELPSGFDALETEARAEGYRMIDRLVTDWHSGAVRSDRAGEALLIAHEEGIVAGIGGLTVDPVIPDALRMRRFYVRPDFRHSGVGRTIAAALISRIRSAGTTITVNAGAGSAGFWEAIGFVSQVSDGHTHVFSPS